MKVRYTMTVTYTTNITKKALAEDYGYKPVTIEEAIETDRENFLDDPYFLIDGGKISIVSEILGK